MYINYPHYVKTDTYLVKEINAKDAAHLVKQYHYSGKVVPNSKIHLGVFNKEKDLCGVLSYGPPMNGDSTSSKLSSSENMMELNRMVMRDEEPRNSESMAIGLCNKWLRKFTDIDYILSFSDGKQGNVGYIYQATNWKYIGYLVSDSFYELDGDVMHSVSVWHKYKESHRDREEKTTHQILFDNYDTVSRIESKQHMYVLPLHHKVTFNFDTKPYPKKDTEIPILRRITYKQNGDVLSTPHKNEFSTEILNPVF
jgi:hypothetical protein